MKAGQTLGQKSKVIADRVTILVEAIRNDEAGNDKERFDAQPAVLTAPLEPVSLSEGEMEPADGESGKSAKGADDSDLGLTGHYDQDSIERW